MKKIFIPILLCVAGLFASCSQDFLEIPEKGVIPEENFYQTDEDALSALTSMYHGVQTNLCSIKGGNIYVAWMFAFNLPGDDVYAACKEYLNNDFQAAVNEFRFDSSSEIISYAYRNYYLANYYCNLITDHFKYGESAIKDRVISEARVIRAYIHMMLAIGWNNPPLVDHVLVGSDKPTNYEGGHKELLLWCAKECEEAAQYLDERKDIYDKENTFKVSKGLAWTVQGKSLLFAEEYELAKVPLKKVIDSGKYKLVPGERYGELFHVEGDGNEEKIFECNIIRNTGVSSFTQMYNYSTWQHMNMWCWRGDRLGGIPTECGVGANGWGGLGVQADFAKEFVENDGDSPRRKATIISYEELLYELNYPSDKKDDGTMMTLEEKKRDPKRGVRDIRGLYGNCEYLQFKRISSPEDVAGHSTWSEANFMFFRYAEVLLMYAECCAQVGDPDGTGLKALNEIQERSGSGKISGSLTLDVVKKEKKFELWTEGCRWADCVRWGDLDGMKKAGQSIPTLYDHFFDADESTRTETHEFYVVYKNFNETNPSITEYGFKEGKHEFFPFPNLETSINPNIVQNPGWSGQ